MTPARILCVLALLSWATISHAQVDGAERKESAERTLRTPRPEWQFPGLHPGDRWCVVTARWLQAYDDGVAAPVVLAATSERALELVPLEALGAHAVDVPDDPGMLT